MWVLFVITPWTVLCPVCVLCANYGTRCSCLVSTLIKKTCPCLGMWSACHLCKNSLTSLIRVMEVYVCVGAACGFHHTYALAHTRRNKIAFSVSMATVYSLLIYSSQLLFGPLLFSPPPASHAPPSTFHLQLFFLLFFHCRRHHLTFSTLDHNYRVYVHLSC